MGLRALRSVSPIADREHFRQPVRDPVDHPHRGDPVAQAHHRGQAAFPGDEHGVLGHRGWGEQAAVLNRLAQFVEVIEVAAVAAAADDLGDGVFHDQMWKRPTSPPGLGRHLHVRRRRDACRRGARRGRRRGGRGRTGPSRIPRCGACGRRSTGPGPAKLRVPGRGGGRCASRLRRSRRRPRGS